MISRVCQTSQSAGVDEVGDYSYSPSLLRSELERDTPQSVARLRRRRSHSSWSCSSGPVPRKRSRRALSASDSGATPSAFASLFRAASSSGSSVMTIALSSQPSSLYGYCEPTAVDGTDGPGQACFANASDRGTTKLLWHASHT